MKILASCDDGAKLDLRVADLCKKYGVHCIFYIPSAWTIYNTIQGREPLSIQDVKDLSKEFEIGGHTITHPMLTRISLGEAFKEIIDCKDHLTLMTGKPVNSFAYPKGYAHEEHKDIVRKHYKTGRSVMIGRLEQTGDQAFLGSTVHVSGVKRKEYQNTDWLDEARYYLELARKRKDAVYSFFCHSWEIDKFREWDKFEIFLQEITA